MTSTILLPGKQGLMVGRRYHEELLRRTLELAGDAPEIRAAIDDGIGVGIWSPADDPPHVRALTIPALQRAVREALEALDRRDEWDERDTTGHWLIASMKLYIDFEDDLADLFGRPPDIPARTLRHDVPSSRDTRRR